MNNVTNQQIFEVIQEVKKQNNDIRADIQDIKRDLAEHRLRVLELEEKVGELVSENSRLKERVKYSEEAAKRNQVVVFGLEERTEDSLENRIIDTFTNILLVNIKPQDLDNIYRIGTKSEGRHRPVVVRFVRYFVKRQILQNLKKLKGTGITVTNDLTIEQQQNQKLLYKYFKIAKSKNFEAKISKNYLIVNENTFSVTDLKQASAESFTDFFINKKQLFPSNSAPATPERQSTIEITIPNNERTPNDQKDSPKENTVKQKSRAEEGSRQPQDGRLREGSKKQDNKSQGPSTPIISRTTRQTGRTNSTSSLGKAAEKPNRRLV